MEINPKDLVIVDRGSPTEEPAFVYLVSDNFVGVCNLDGDRYIVAKDRLTICDNQGNPSKSTYTGGYSSDGDDIHNGPSGGE